MSRGQIRDNFLHNIRHLLHNRKKLISTRCLLATFHAHQSLISEGVGSDICMSFISLYSSGSSVAERKFYTQFVYNLRSGSIFVSLWNNIPVGKAKRKWILAVAVRENIWEPLKLSLISG